MVPGGSACSDTGTRPQRPNEEFSHLVKVRREALAIDLTQALDRLGSEGQAVLDLGCGHGHFLAELARAHLDHRCFGVDYCRDRIRRANRKQHRAGLGNLSFIHAEAGAFLAAVPKSLRFNYVFILFPDPWPKRRHRKNRLVQAPLLETLNQVCAPGCLFCFRSDAGDYVEEVRDLLSAHARWAPAPRTSFPFETETVFQKKAAKFDSAMAVRVS